MRRGFRSKGCKAETFDCFLSPLSHLCALDFFFGGPMKSLWARFEHVFRLLCLIGLFMRRRSLRSSY